MVKERRLTPKQEQRAHLYHLAGLLTGSYVTARYIAQLESLGKSLRKRFENACNYEWASSEEGSYAARTEKMVEEAEHICHVLGRAGVTKHEIQRDPRGSSIRLWAKDGDGIEREFYL